MRGRVGLGGSAGTRLESNCGTTTLRREYRKGMSLIQAKRASEVLSVSLARLYELARLGVIPVVRLGPRQIRFDEEALTQWARQGGLVQGNGAAHANDAARSGSNALS